MSNKNDLKAFVRYDANGNIVAGSLIVQRFKPKGGGNWVEIDAYDCCVPNTTTSTTTALLALRLLFDNIENVNILVGDASDVANWNTFFDLPAYGTEFTSVTIIGNNVYLYGGANIETKENLFSDYGHLLEVWDYAGCIVTLGDQTFGGFSYNSILEKVYFPEVTEIIGDPDNYGALGTCQNLNYAYLPKCKTIGACAFYDSSLLYDDNLILPFDEITILPPWAFSSTPISDVNRFINATDIGFSCFENCNDIISVNLPLVTTLDIASFSNCLSLTTISLPQLTTAKHLCFLNCTSLTTINIPSCTDLGETVGDDNVFLIISGNNITLTVPSALMTCNAGNPDGDIQYLQANNTVTVVTV